MRKVILYIATSLDGFISGPNDELDWLPGSDGTTAEGEETDDFGYHAFLESIDTTLMGRKTFDVTRKLTSENPYPGKTNYVFSRSAQAQKVDGFEWIQEDAVSFVRQLKLQEGGNIWLVGGGELNAILFNADLIDEIRLTVFPVVLGKGKPLFSEKVDKKELKTQTVSELPGGAVQWNLGTS